MVDAIDLVKFVVITDIKDNCEMHLEMRWYNMFYQHKLNWTTCTLYVGLLEIIANNSPAV